MKDEAAHTSEEHRHILFDGMGRNLLYDAALCFIMIAVGIYTLCLQQWVLGAFFLGLGSVLTVCKIFQVKAVLQDKYAMARLSCIAARRSGYRRQYFLYTLKAEAPSNLSIEVKSASKFRWMPGVTYQVYYRSGGATIQAADIFCATHVSGIFPEEEINK